MTVKQGDIEKTGGNGKKKKTTSTLFSLVDVPANLQRSDKRERDQDKERRQHQRAVAKERERGQLLAMKNPTQSREQ